MKFRLFLLLILLFLRPAASAADKGKLDLPDILVWGEDRSELPGLGGKDMFFLPYLARSSYLDPLALKNPFKTYPGEDYYVSRSGLKALAGYGMPDEHILRVTWARYTMDNWSYDVDMLNSSESFSSPSVNYDSTAARFNLGRRHRFLRWRLGGRAALSDFGPERNMWRADGRAFSSFYNVAIEPYFEVAGAGNDSSDSHDHNMGLRLKTPVRYNQWVSASVDLSGQDISGSERTWSESSFSYTNMLFLDFSFMLAAGYRSRYGEDVFYSGRITGEILHTGYSVFIRSESGHKDIFTLSNMYPMLLIENMYDSQWETSAGISVARSLGNAGELGGSISITDIKDGIYTVSMASYTALANFSGTDRRSEAALTWNKDFISARMLMTGSSEDLPGLPSRLEVSLNPKLGVGLEKKIDTLVTFKYFSKYDIWYDSAGIFSDTADPFISLDAVCSYDITENIKISAGLQNILANETRIPGSFYSDEQKIYFTVGYGLKKDLK